MFEGISKSSVPVYSEKKPEEASMRPVSSDYSDVEEISKKPVRAPSASSDYSDIVSKPTLESSQTASGSVKSLHEMFEGRSKTSSVKEESIVEKKITSSS